MEWLDGLKIVFIGSESPAPDNWFYHYQSLIAGIIALIAAAITTGMLICHQNFVIRRRQVALRSNLPLALSKLHDYADTCLFELARLIQNNQEHSDIQNQLCVPDLPQSSLETITGLIEFSNSGDARFLQALLRQLQIQHARLRLTHVRLGPDRQRGALITRNNLREDVLDAFIIKVMTDHIFGFARYEVDAIPAYKSGSVESGGFFLQDRFDTLTMQYVRERLGRNVADSFADRA